MKGLAHQLLLIIIIIKLTKVRQQIILAVESYGVAIVLRSRRRQSLHTCMVLKNLRWLQLISPLICPRSILSERTYRHVRDSFTTDVDDHSENQLCQQIIFPMNRLVGFISNVKYQHGLISIISIH